MAISGLGIGAVSRRIWPMILVMLIVLFLTTYVPEFALLLAG
jgi:C4-dicarboxylate transporter DctM subunit